MKRLMITPLMLSNTAVTLPAKVTASMLLGLLLAGCSSSAPSSTNRLADLPAFDRSILSEQPMVSEQQLDSLYQQILTLAPAAQTRQKILYRLSQMHTSQLERQELAPEQEQQALQQLISRYQQLLQDYPDDPNNELIRYQLARSYDLTAQQQACLEQLDTLLQLYPHSVFSSEAWFRKADIHYSRAQYEQALAAYQSVLDGSDLPLRRHARYMAGWSYFKLQQFASADEQFLALLDDTYQQTQSQQDDASVQSLRTEVLNILSISLSYQQQAQSVQPLLARVSYGRGERPLGAIAELYQALAQFLQQKQLNAASLAAYQDFIQHYADSIEAARFQAILIDTHLSVGDAVAALNAQQQYIRLFGPESAFWRKASTEALLEAQPRLLQYLDYFAREQFSQTQTQQAAARQQAFALSIPWWQQLLAVLTSPKLAGSAQHQQALATYNVADVRYLLAESYQGSGERALALPLYIALGFTEQQSGTLFSAQDAAYKALLLSSSLSEADDTVARGHWQLQTEFIRQHSTHPAAQQVALQQLQQRYTEQDYAAVIANSTVVTQWQHLSQPALVQEAAFLHSQSELALARYADAERSISALLADPQQPALSASRKALLNEQLASSIYQQAQQAGISQLAVSGHLQRLLGSLADSPYHEAAAYQQIEMALAQGEQTLAISQLLAFISRYPQSERLSAAKAHLLQSYEQTGQWQQAADMLMAVQRNAAEPQQQREALYLAAQYYQRAEKTQAAIDAWRSYANRFTTPHVLAQEARFNLTQLYQATNDVYRRNFWLDKIAGFEQNNASSGTARTQQLAAQALLALGQHESMLFSGVRLAHPLKQSLQKKRQHMSAAIRHYEQSMQYGVASVLSEAQFRVAELYQQMASALLESDRPKGLDALALEEYDLLLEEQAYPFEEQAIAIYQQNTRLTQQQVWDNWVEQSFARLAQLLPAKFDKPAAFNGVADDAY